ncbi:MAG: Uma2 family endonuclease [Myxococcales bacterium]|nr:Uma2 family endonuclease [Myxococcales bacterium]
MRAVMLEVSSELLEQRRKHGGDRFDEVWEGVLHMVPSPSIRHQHLESKLIVLLSPIAQRRGFIVLPEAGLVDPPRGWNDYRQPDISVVRPEHLSERAIEGRAELVIEILSPNDESRDKLPFYARMRVQEVWLLEPRTYELEVFALREDRYECVEPVLGVMRSRSLDVEVQVLAGPVLRIRDGEHVAEL